MGRSRQGRDASSSGCPSRQGPQPAIDGERHFPAALHDRKNIELAGALGGRHAVEMRRPLADVQRLHTALIVHAHSWMRDGWVEPVELSLLSLVRSLDPDTILKS